MARDLAVVGKGSGSAPQESIVADGFVTVREASEFLGLGLTRVYQLMTEGRLAYAKIGRSRRIPRRELMRFAEEILQGGNRPFAA